MNLAYRDIRHNWGRFVLTAVGLGLLLGVVLAMMGIYRGLVNDALSLLQRPDADVWVVEAGTLGPFAEPSQVRLSVRNSIAHMDGVDEAGAILYQSLEVPRANDTTVRIQLVGFESGRLGGPPEVIDGRGKFTSRYELVADVKTGFQLGEWLTIAGTGFRVVGLIKNQVSSGGDPVVYAELKDAQEVAATLAPGERRSRAGTGTSEATASAILVRVRDGADPYLIASNIERWKHLDALTQGEQEDLLLRSVIAMAKKQIGLFTAILLMVSTVIIGLILYTMTMDKIREIATLKLIGAPDRIIVMMVVQQALALGGIGYAVGTAMIMVVKDGFPRNVMLQTTDVVMLGGVVLLACLVASGLGVRLALRVDPSTALGG
ncbi:MAG: ABC transporter permease [Rhodospirillaceae bacterium]|nr:ABC transporter permease [Rhodospirillaceae bacterium]